MLYCNGRRKNFGHLSKREVSEMWAGEGYCKQKAGKGTDHVGQGRCKFHGGATPIKHGRYSSVQREELRKLMEQLEDDEDPLDILPELAAARALLTDFINRYAEISDALVKWNAGAPDQARPQRLPDLSHAIQYLKTVAQIAQKEKKLQLDNAISRKDLLRVLSEMARSVESRVDDDETVAKIKDDWSGIRLA